VGVEERRQNRVASEIGAEEHQGVEVASPEAGELSEVRALLLEAVTLEEGEDRLHGLHALFAFASHRSKKDLIDIGGVMAFDTSKQVE
jgi:hypothetical protein